MNMFSYRKVFLYIWHERTYQWYQDNFSIENCHQSKIPLGRYRLPGCFLVLHRQPKQENGGSNYKVGKKINHDDRRFTCPTHKLLDHNRRLAVDG